MALTHSVTQKISAGSRTLQVVRDFTGSGSSSINESIPDSASDLEVDFALDVSQAVSVWMCATGGAITVETNSAAPGDDTISLADGVPQLFLSTAVGGLSGLFSADVTALFVSNSSGGAVTLDVEALFDATV